MPWIHLARAPTPLETSLLDALDFAVDTADWQTLEFILDILDGLSCELRPGRREVVLH